MKKLFGVLTAVLALSMVFTMVSCGDSPSDDDKKDKITISFDLDGGAGTKPADVTIDKGTSLGTKFPTMTGVSTFQGWFDASDNEVVATTKLNSNQTLKAKWQQKADDEITVTFVDGYSTPSAKVGEAIIKKGAKLLITDFPTATRTGYDFDKWVDDDNVEVDTDYEFGDDDATVTATWTAGSVTLTAVANPPGGKDVIEKVTLKNSWFALYQFTLPAGKYWEDYSDITVEYQLDQDTLDNGVGRAFRLLGNYKLDELSLVDFEDGSGKIVVADYNTLGNGDRILAHLAGSYGGNIADELTNAGVTAVADTWFTLTYPLDGSKKNAAYQDANLPAADATGPFYFGVGLPGQDGANTFLVKNITLTNGTPADDVVATFAYFSDGTDSNIPGFVGYPSADGADGAAEAKRKIAALAPAVGTGGIETVTLKNSWFALYRFDLPAGAYWEDYTDITAEYLLDQDTLDNGVGRAIRLLGNYKPGEITLINRTDGGDNLAVADYNTLGNGDRILAHLGGSYGGNIADELTNAGVTAVADTWFTLTYPLDGSKKNAAYQDANLPEPDATGPFYFGVGLPGQDGANTFLVKNVTLVGAGATPVVATSAVFEDLATGDLVPAFVGYPTASGADGVAEAKREFAAALQLPASWSNGNNQQGWRNSAAPSGGAAYLSLDDIIKARYLVLQLNANNINGLEIVCANEGTDWQKVQNSPDLNWDNTVDATEQTKLDTAGIVWDDVNFVLTIPLEQAFGFHYAAFAGSATWAGILLQLNNFGTVIDGAWLVK